jgi:signal transduction histidine kinase
VFQRLHSHNYQGTGIGLAICKKIVDNHNGFIRAESHLNEGTRFIVTLPVKKVRERKAVLN